MAEQRKTVYARKTRSGKGVRMIDGDVVYIASIKSIERFLQGECDFIAFAKFPYRKSEAEFKEADTILTTCPKCGRMREFRKVNENEWECEECGTRKTASELIHGIRQLIEGF